MAEKQNGTHNGAHPSAMALPPKGYTTEIPGRYGPTFPQTPANYGFTIIAKIKPGTEKQIRAYGKTVEDAVAGSPDVLAPLQLHYLRWVLFDIGSDTYFMYQGIFDTDFDKYTEDAIALSAPPVVTTVFTLLEGFPEDWKDQPLPPSSSSVREHHHPSFLSTVSIPSYPRGSEEALNMRRAFSVLLDESQ
jgi:hypothetical protein